MIEFKLLLLLPLLVASCGAFKHAEVNRDAEEIARLSNELAGELHLKLSSEDSNVFFSPFSISTALAMLFYGTKGETASEMRRILGYQDAKLSDTEVHSAFHSILNQYGAASDKYQLYVANALLTQKNYPIRDEYKSALERLYHAKSRDVDFQNEGSQVVEEINNWVKQSTRNQITKFLDEIDPNTALLLLNAVYFKGTWKTEFDPEETMKDFFYNKGLEDSRVTVPFMRVAGEFPYLRLGGMKVLELPYKGDDISMLILLPDKRNGLSELEEGMKENIIRHFRLLRRRLKKTEVHVDLPKFKLEYEKTLNDVLKAIGLKSIFGNNADLTGISEVGNLAVSKVGHKAAIEVNEEGSEASAITVIDPYNRIGGGNELKFKVDHPFLFFIVDTRTDLILFQGGMNVL